MSEIETETEAKQALTEAELELKQQRIRKIRFIQAIFFVVWLLATVLTIAACWYLLAKVGGQNGLIGMIVVLVAGGLPVVLGGGYVVFKVIPETLED